MKGEVKLYCELCAKFKLKKGYTAEDVYNIIHNYDISSPVSLTLENCIKKFIDAKEYECLSPNTIGTYRCSLKKFSLWCLSKKITINDITKNTIKTYISHLQTILKDSSVAYNVTVLRIFFTFLENEYIVDKNPAKGVTYKTKKTFRKALNMKEVKAIKKACITAREKALIDFMLDTGCRVSEIINLKLVDIDFDQNSARVTGKGSKERTVLFTNKTKKSLQHYLLNAKNKEYLFSATIHPFKKLERFAVNAIVKEIVGRTNITSKVSPHIFRHTFATIALEKGMDIVSIQKLLGHENLSTTQIYAEMSLNTVKKQYNKYFNI